MKHGKPNELLKKVIKNFKQQSTSFQKSQKIDIILFHLRKQNKKLTNLNMLKVEILDRIIRDYRIDINSVWNEIMIANQLQAMEPKDQSEEKDRVLEANYQSLPSPIKTQCEYLYNKAAAEARLKKSEQHEEGRRCRCRWHPLRVVNVIDLPTEYASYVSIVCERLYELKEVADYLDTVEEWNNGNDYIFK